MLNVLVNYSRVSSPNFRWLAFKSLFHQACGLRNNNLNLCYFTVQGHPADLCHTSKDITCTKSSSGVVMLGGTKLWAEYSTLDMLWCSRQAPYLSLLFSHLQNSEIFAEFFEIWVKSAMCLCMIIVIKNIEPLFRGKLNKTKQKNPTSYKCFINR